MLALIALAALIFGATPAHAAPLAAAIVTAVTGITGVAASIIGSIVVGVVSTGLSLLLKKKPDQQDGGVELTIQVDGTLPETLLVGRAVTAGSRVDIEAYGNDNKNCIEIIGVADHPIDAFETVYIEAQAAALTDTGTDRGSTIDGYGGKVAIKLYDGSQTTADTFAVSALSGNDERPWTSNHVGNGRAYARVHYIYDRDKMTGPVNFKFVCRGIRLYNPALDDTVGGSGDHRWDDIDTHEWTANLAVIAYNILRGIRVKNSVGDLVHFYGLEKTTAAQLPLDKWLARIAEADEAVALAAGGTEPRYHGGLEIPVNMAPVDALQEILKATGWRYTEVGGAYRLFGEPGLPAYAFSDGDLPANQGDTGEPVLPLEQLTTSISGTFLSPDDGWVEKPAVPRINADREAEIGQRVESDLSALMVQSDAHMQRLMQQILARVQRSRRETVVLGPEFFGIGPGDVTEYTNASRGYDAKLFEVQAAEIDVNLFTTVHLIEIDHDDYDWDPGDQIVRTAVSLVATRPPAKVISGFSAAAGAQTGDTGAKRPKITVTWTPPDDDDVIGVSIQIRRPTDPTDVVTFGVNDTESIAAGEAVILAGLAPLTDYEVRARFISFLGRDTEWSLWIPVTTPDTAISAVELDANLQAWLQQLDISRQAALGPVLDEIRERVAQLGQTTAGLVALLNERVEGSIVNYIGQANASITEVRTVAEGLADLFVNVFVGNDTRQGNGLFRITAGDGPEGVGASISLEARALVADLFKKAGIYLDVFADVDGGLSRVRLVGDQVFIEDLAGNVVNALLLTVQDEPTDASIVFEDADVIRANLTSRAQRHATLLTTAAEMRAPIGIVPMDYTHTITQDGTGHALTFSDEYLLPHPTISELPTTVNVLRISVLSKNPPKLTVSADDPRTESKIWSFRDEAHFFGRGGSSQVLWNIASSGLDFAPGTLLVLLAAGRCNNSTGTFGATVTVDNGTMSGWTPISSYMEQFGSISNAQRLRAMYRIADGSEGNVQPFVFGGTASSQQHWGIYQILAFDILGGSISTAGAQHADLGSGTGSGFGPFTIEGAGKSVPLLGVSFIGRFGGSAGTFSFSETPDLSYSLDDPDGVIGSFYSKAKLYDADDTPADITAQWTVSNPVGGLMTLALHM